MFLRAASKTERRRMTSSEEKMECEIKFVEECIYKENSQALILMTLSNFQSQENDRHIMLQNINKLKYFMSHQTDLLLAAFIIVQARVHC